MLCNVFMTYYREITVKVNMVKSLFKPLNKFSNVITNNNLTGLEINKLKNKKL